MDKIDLINVRDIGRQLEQAFLETCQNRTNYQLDELNVKSHETPERQYKQCLDELVRKVAEIGRLEITVEELTDDIAEQSHIEALADTDYAKRRANRERRRHELNLWQTRIHLEGQLREFKTLYSIYDTMPKFTAAQIQAAEPEYYRLRKFKQAALQLESDGRVDPELMNVLTMMGAVPDDYATGFEKLLEQAKAKKELSL